MMPNVLNALAVRFKLTVFSDFSHKSNELTSEQIKKDLIESIPVLYKKIIENNKNKNIIMNINEDEIKFLEVRYNKESETVIVIVDERTKEILEGNQDIHISRKYTLNKIYVDKAAHRFRRLENGEFEPVTPPVTPTISRKSLRNQSLLNISKSDIRNEISKSALSVDKVQNENQSQAEKEPEPEPEPEKKSFSKDLNSFINSKISLLKNLTKNGNQEIDSDFSAILKHLNLKEDDNNDKITLGLITDEKTNRKINIQIYPGEPKATEPLCVINPINENLKYLTGICGDHPKITEYLVNRYETKVAKNEKINVGDAKETRNMGLSFCESIIHIIAPNLNEIDNQESMAKALQNFYLRSLLAVHKKEIHSIAFPLLNPESLEISLKSFFSAIIFYNLILTNEENIEINDIHLVNDLETTQKILNYIREHFKDNKNEISTTTVSTSNHDDELDIKNSQPKIIPKKNSIETQSIESSLSQNHLDRRETLRRSSLFRNTYSPSPQSRRSDASNDSKKQIQNRQSSLLNNNENRPHYMSHTIASKNKISLKHGSMSRERSINTGSITNLKKTDSQKSLVHSRKSSNEKISVSLLNEDI